MTSSMPGLQRNGVPRSASALPARSHRRAAQRLAALLIGAGTAHFLIPRQFDAIVPAELPGDARVYTHASGIAEIAVGALLLAPRTRRIGALAAAGLFLAVFPANLNMVRLWRNKPLPMHAVAVARLPLQIPMITEAVRIYRDR